jgi:hypothetical protein
MMDKLSDTRSWIGVAAFAFAWAAAGAAGTVGAFSAARKIKKEYVYSQIEMVPV